MARIIPDIDPRIIDNNGEKAFYTAASKLPEGYTVIYSYKYQSDEDPDQVYEADFIIVHPSLGFLVVEVKQGDISYFNGQWIESKDKGYKSMKKDPVEQARNAMFAIVRQYTTRTKNKFPLKIKYAVCFPECSKISGDTPSDLDKRSILLFHDLNRLEEKILQLFDAADRRPELEATSILLDKILAPSFRAFSNLEDRMEMFRRNAEIILTEEQQRILEETELDSRKIFFGAAGTGKTLLAKEKAKRLACEGKKVFLTCYNRYLAKYEFSQLAPNVTALNFHTYIENELKEKGLCAGEPETIEEKSFYFESTLPTLAFDYYTEIPDSTKFDAAIIDEGQDFKEEWITCVESMVKEGGEFYIFADPNQCLFNKDIEKIKKLDISKQKLTKNLRNAEEVNNWISQQVPAVQLKSTLKSGIPVKHMTWRNQREEKKLIEDEIGRLVSQGVKPSHITILSPHKQDKSCLAGLQRVKEWPLAGIGEQVPNAVRFATIRSFKGLESDIVFLIDVKDDDKACTKADIYVGGSRARFLLYVFEEEAKR